MNCEGKCHLKKQLEKEDKKEEAPTSLKEKSEIQFCSVPLSPTFAFTNSTILHNTTYLLVYPDSPGNTIFHPPSLAYPVS